MLLDPMAGSVARPVCA